MTTDPQPTISEKQYELLYELAGKINEVVAQTDEDPGFLAYINTHSGDVFGASWEETAAEVQGIADRRRQSLSDA